MKILLLEKIRKLGDVGDLITVKDGFARNHLLIRKKAIRFTKDNEEKLQNERAIIEKANAEKKNLALKHGKILKGKTMEVIRQAGDDGKLYGSVSNKDISNMFMSEFQINVAIEHIYLEKKIKEIGCYDVIATLHPEVRSKVRLNVVRS